MRTLKISLCFFIIISFVSCSKGEFINIVSFVDSYNELSDSAFSLSDFIISDEAETEYTVITNDVIMSLKEDDDGKIYMCRILIKKGTENYEQQTENFRQELKLTIMTYCNYTYKETEDVINTLSLNDKTTFSKSGELTLKKDNFCFVYYSNEISSEVRIINTYLQKIEPTEKPESKPFYGENFIEKD